jgi:pimeloyl-ACP methyl ester carboxylesterase
MFEIVPKSGFMPVAQAGEVSLYYEVEGRGEPLVLIPGFGTCRRWRGSSGS